MPAGAERTQRACRLRQLPRQRRRVRSALASTITPTWGLGVVTAVIGPGAEGFRRPAYAMLEVNAHIAGDGHRRRGRAARTVRTRQLGNGVHADALGRRISAAVDGRSANDSSGSG